MKNTLLWLVTLEATVVLALSMMIAVLCEGWRILVWLGVCNACMDWVGFFLYINAWSIRRGVRRTARKAKKVIGRVAARPTKRGKSLTIVTFPVERVTRHTTEVKRV